jgi:hypothetical protein
VDNWLTEVFLATGPAAEARRTKALPLIIQDATRVPDHYISGPEPPLNETIRQRFFGEEWGETLQTRHLPRSCKVTPRLPSAREVA